VLVCKLCSIKSQVIHFQSGKGDGLESELLEDAVCSQVWGKQLFYFILNDDNFHFDDASQ